MGYYLEVKRDIEDYKELRSSSALYTIDINDDKSIEIYDKNEGIWYRAEYDGGAHYAFFPPKQYQHPTRSGRIYARFYMSLDVNDNDKKTWVFRDTENNKDYDIFIEINKLKAADTTNVGTVWSTSGDYSKRYILYNSLAEGHEKPITINGKEPFNFKPILKGIGKFFFWYIIIASIYVLITDPATFFGDIVEQPGIFICFGIFMVFLFRITRKNE